MISQTSQRENKTKQKLYKQKLNTRGIKDEKLGKEASGEKREDEGGRSLVMAKRKVRKLGKKLECVCIVVSLQLHISRRMKRHY